MAAFPDMNPRAKHLVQITGRHLALPTFAFFPSPHRPEPGRASLSEATGAALSSLSAVFRPRSSTQL